MSNRTIPVPLTGPQVHAIILGIGLVQIVNIQRFGSDFQAPDFVQSLVAKASVPWGEFSELTPEVAGATTVLDLNFLELGVAAYGLAFAHAFQEAGKIIDSPHTLEELDVWCDTLRSMTQTEFGGEIEEMAQQLGAA
jgi:hypothetical protein